MHEKCVILRFEIVVFSVIGLCNVNGQHRWFGLDLLLPSTDGLCRQNQNVPPKYSLNCLYYQTKQCGREVTVRPENTHLRLNINFKLI